MKSISKIKPARKAAEEAAEQQRQQREQDAKIAREQQNAVDEAASMKVARQLAAGQSQDYDAKMVQPPMPAVTMRLVDDGEDNLEVEHNNEDESSYILRPADQKYKKYIIIGAIS